MKPLKKFVAYLEDNSNHIGKVVLPANSISEAKKYLHGNGEIIKIKDITNEYPISINQVKKALLAANFGEVEISLILRTLQYTNIADVD